MPPTNGSSTGLDWLQSLQTDHEGLKGVIYAEELHWGCAGIALAISASALCAAGIASSGTPEQIGRWIPEVVGSKGNPRLGRVCRHRAVRRVRRQVAAHDRQARRRRLDPERHQDLHLERRHRRRDRRRRDRRPGPRPPRPGLLRRHGGQPRPEARPQGVEARHPGVADGRDRARGLPRARRRTAGRRREAAAQARARALGPALQGLRRARDLRDHPPDRGRLGARHRPGGVRVDPRAPLGPHRRGPAAASGAAHPAGARRRGDRDRVGPPARVASGVDGAQRRPDDRRPGVDVEAEGRRRRDVGDDRVDGPRRPGGAVDGATRWRSGSATRRSTSSSRAPPRSSGWSSRACRRPSTPSGSSSRRTSPRRRRRTVPRTARWWRRRRATLRRSSLAGEPRRRRPSRGRWCGGRSDCRGIADAPRAPSRARLDARRAGNRRRMAMALAINVALLVATVVGGLLADSLALLADAGHLASDVGRDRDRADRRPARGRRPDAGADVRAPAQRGARCARERRAVAGRGGADRGRGAHPAGRSARRRRGGDAGARFRRPGRQRGGDLGARRRGARATSTSRACCATRPPTRSARSA